MIKGCLRICSPWKAKSSTKVASRARMEAWPRVARVASRHDCPPCLSRALRQTWAIATGIRI